MLLRNACEYAGKNQVRMSSRTQAQVTQIQDKATFFVDLEKCSCTCYRFQEHRVPCGHAVSVMHRLNLAPADFMPSYLRLTTVVSAYQAQFPAINLEEVRLLAQGADIAANAVSDSDSDTDTDSASSSDLSDPPLDPSEPPLTKVPRGRPKKKRMRKDEAHRQRNKRAARR
jgi:hypothetical protein